MDTPLFRVPVTVLRSENGRYDIVYCNDGSIWRLDNKSGEWAAGGKPLPGSPAARGVHTPDK